MSVRNSTRSIEEIWQKYDAMEARLSAPLSRSMVQAAKLAGGMRVLDVGCGRGEPALEAAASVGPDGYVLGIDAMSSMLDMARTRAASMGISHIDFRVHDAETWRAEEHTEFDAALSRWCFMYLRNPAAAATAVHRSLKLGGRFVIAVWCDPEETDYYTLPRRALDRLHPLPAESYDIPGPFQFAEPGKLEGLLSSCGFEIETVAEMRVDVMEAESAEELIEWAVAFGMGRLLQGIAPAVRKRWETEFVEAVSRRCGNGCWRLGGISRIVTGVRTQK